MAGLLARFPPPPLFCPLLWLSLVKLFVWGEGAGGGPSYLGGLVDQKQWRETHLLVIPRTKGELSATLATSLKITRAAAETYHQNSRRLSRFSGDSNKENSSASQNATLSCPLLASNYAESYLVPISFCSRSGEADHSLGFF